MVDLARRARRGQPFEAFVADESQLLWLRGTLHRHAECPNFSRGC